MNRLPSPTLLRRATWVFLALGVTIRLVRYLLNYPLWGDEAFVAVDFLDRGYRDLLRPMTYHQICPIGFLWAERTAVKLLGFHEWSLRLVPILCALASMVLFRRLAALLVGGVPGLLALAVFAVSYYPIRHSAEVKPYASDLLAALALLVPAAEWLRRPEQARRWAWTLAALGPLAVLGSHPVAFVVGGVALALVRPAWRGRQAGTLLPFGLFLSGSAATFLALYLGFTAVQARDVSAGPMTEYWSEAFPPRTSAVALLRWLAEVHTGHMFAYPAGGAHGLSLVTALAVLAGLVTLIARRNRPTLALLAGPFALNLLAAAVHAYPYGETPRVMQYAAPATCLLAGLGVDRLFSWTRTPGRRTRRTVVALAALAATGSALLVGEILSPGRSTCDQRSREFARWLWSEKGRHAEVACVKSDLGLTLDPAHWDHGRTALYLCNRALHGTHPPGTPPAWDRITDDHPLACVFYNQWPKEDPAFQNWLNGMTRRYTLRSRATFDVNIDTGRYGDLEDRYTVLEFVPLNREAAPPLRTETLAGSFGGDPPGSPRQSRK